MLDFTRALAGPTCTRMFAEMGAEVIKVESAPHGEMTRQITKMKADRSFYFIQKETGYISKLCFRGILLQIIL